MTMTLQYKVGSYDTASGDRDPRYHCPGTSATSASKDLDSPDLIHGDQNLDL